MALRIPELAASGKEAFGPFRSYLLTRGLVLNFKNDEAIVTDGCGSSTSFPLPSKQDEYGIFPPQAYAHTLGEVQDDLGIKLVGIGGDSSYRTAFKIDEWVMSAESLAEGLLARLEELERLVRRRVLDSTSINESEIGLGEAMCAKLKDDVLYGRIGPSDLTEKIDSLRRVGIPIDQTFFLFNATSISEDMRHALLAACYHFCALNSGIRTINQAESPAGSGTRQAHEPWEFRLYSGEIDELSYSYTSSLVACYTALDLLYVLFVYLTREPFLNPELPSNLHFPDAPGRKIFQSGGSARLGDPPKEVLPYAIANLKSGEFASLRKARNALVHNMAPDSIRPRVFRGWKLPPVNGKPLQYVQYLSRDIDSDGEPVTHHWVRRFYETQTDAQNSLLEWLELTWQCAFDTVEWLHAHWSNSVRRN